MKNNFRVILVTTVMWTTPAWGNTVGIPEGSAVSAIQDAVESYTDRNDGQLPNQWRDLFRSPMELTFIDQSIKPRSVSELYAFVISPQRDLFPDGKLLLIRVAELPWPDEWKTGVNTGGYSLDEIRKAATGEIEKAQAYQRPIRYIIFQDKRGRIRSDWWYEDKIQEMLSQTGIIIPLPTPYRYSPPTIPGETTNAPSPVSAITSNVGAGPVPAPKQSPAPVPPSPTKHPTNMLWWIIGLLVVVGSVAVATRKKKPKT